MTMTSAPSPSTTAKFRDPLSLTQDFILLRNNAIQRRRFQRETEYHDSEDEHSVNFGSGADDDARVRLLRDEEAALGLSPEYVAHAENLEYLLSRLDQQLAGLNRLHQTHLARPTLDDANEEEKIIASQTKEVTIMFNQSHEHLKRIQRNTLDLTGPEGVITKNLVLAMSNRLQALTEAFQKSQSNYLKSVKAREATTSQYFEEYEDLIDTSGPALDSLAPPPGADPAGRITTQELLMLEEDTSFIEQRHKEVESIAKSIQELNQIFRDLGEMVSEQGTIIDRIEYNTEDTQVRVEEGLEQLKKAEKYHNKSRKFKCIVISAVIAFVLFLILVYSS